MLGVLLSVDASFFYPRIETDQLLYLLKAKSLVETGSTAAQMSVNTRPFLYAAMPGVLRAPFLLIFSDFDAQLRGIQMMNVAIATLTAIMSAYILSWALPERAHRWAIAFAFGYTILSPDWLTNIFVPLADAPYAALTQGCLIVAAMTLTSKKPLASRGGAVALLAILFAVAFFVRYTAPVLLLFAGMLAWQRWSAKRIPPVVLAAVVIVPIVILAGLVALSADALFGRYIWEPLAFLKYTEKIGVALHLLASALPTQIVPVFNLGFEVPPLSVQLAPVFGTTPRDFAWSVTGLYMSALVIRGMLISRARFLPELVYFLAPLPVLALMTPSTTRYLMSYQPIIWICLFTGLASVTEQWRRRASPLQLRVIAGSLAIAAVAGMLLMRSARTARTAGGDVPATSIARGRAYVHDVEETFKGLRTFLEQLPAERTLLIGGGGNVGRFKVIANRDYYRPDSSLTRVARDKDVYAVLACGTAATCQEFEDWIRRQARSIDRYGRFTYEPVFDHRTQNARALVLRVIPGESPTYSASGLTAR